MSTAVILVALPLAGAGLALAGSPAPTLLWSNGGCTSFCELGWYASPAVADLDRDGTPDVVAAAYSITRLNGRTGALVWRAQDGFDVTNPSANSVGRTWPDIVIADIDGDGTLDIVTGHVSGYVSAYSAAGKFKSGWPQHSSTTGEIRGLFVTDLDHDGKLAVVASAAVGSAINTWAYRWDGTLHAGWPQLVGAGYAWGTYNTNGAAGDLDGSGNNTVLVPSDVHYACAYAANGAGRAVNASVFGAGKVWGQIGLWESPVPEQRGYGFCDGTRAESYRANMALSPATIADLDGNGRNEVVIAGNVYDCSTTVDQFVAPFALNADRTRFASGAWDWSTPPSTGAPLTEDYNVIENAMFNPVVADLDGDATQELLFPSYDGKLHAFWLDRTEHGSWPFAAQRPGDAYVSFAGEPAVADIDGDGRAEVIVATWPTKASGARGRLFILSDTGAVLRQVDLPAPTGGATWNGALAAPTLADLDGDGNLDIVLQTASSGVVAYSLVGSTHARVMWGTGRWTPQRAGSCPMGNPASVGALRVTKSGANDVQLTWTGVANAPQYDARRATAASMSGATPIGTTGAFAILDPGALTDGKKIVYYQVRGRNTCGVEGP